MPTLHFLSTIFSQMKGTPNIRVNVSMCAFIYRTKTDVLPVFYLMVSTDHWQPLLTPFITVNIQIPYAVNQGCIKLVPILC